MIWKLFDAPYWLKRYVGDFDSVVILYKYRCSSWRYYHNSQDWLHRTWWYIHRCLCKSSSVPSSHVQHHERPTNEYFISTKIRQDLPLRRFVQVFHCIGQILYLNYIYRNPSRRIADDESIDKENNQTPTLDHLSLGYRLSINRLMKQCLPVSLSPTRRIFNLVGAAIRYLSMNLLLIWRENKCMHDAFYIWK